MKNLILPLYFIFSLCLMMGCKGLFVNNKISKEELCNTWQISSIDDKEVKSTGSNKLDLEMSALTVRAMRDGLSFLFLNDGTYVNCTGSAYGKGTWSLEKGGKSIKVFIENGKSDFLNVVSYDKATKKLTLEIMETGLKIEFAQDKPLEDESKNFLHPDHNLWRQKATHHESDAELTARLKNLTQHYIYLLEASLEREKNVVSFAHSQSIIKIYSGGIGCVSEEGIPDSWKNIFFDKANEQRCYELFGEILQKDGDLNITSSGNWAKDDILILKSIYGSFEPQM
jgi:hypothetical protein